MNLLTLLLINSLVVCVVVLLHYEFLYHSTRLLPRFTIKPRLRVVFGVFSALTAHALEIWIFALAYYFLQQHGSFGALLGATDGSLSDCAYYSFSVYTTLGFGDITPAVACVISRASKP